MLCYHGTTFKNAKAIISGNKIKPEGAWNDSLRDDYLYLWPANKVERKEGWESTLQELLYNGFSSAQIQAAIEGENTKLVVLELNIPKWLVDDDISSEIMVRYASCIHFEDLQKDFIKSVYICDYNKWHSPFILASLLKRDNFSGYIMDDSLLSLAQTLSDVNLPAMDELLEFDYRKHDVNFLE